MNATSPDVPGNNSVRFVLVKGTQASAFLTDYQMKVRVQAVSGLGDQAFCDGFASLSMLKGSAGRPTSIYKN